MKFTTATPVTISLTDLQTSKIPFSTLLEAFGASSLGILVVTDLPSSFPALRKKVLSNASRLAHLPAQSLSSLTKPSAKYLVGWSHGVETLRPGVVDTAKGSYYINCAFYKDPALNGADEEKFPGFEEYTAPNVWPSEHAAEGKDATIPDFKSDAEALIGLIIDTAVLVARACDRFAESEVQGYEKGYLERMVRDSETTKARLLHYFPSDAVNTTTNGATNDDHAQQPQSTTDKTDNKIDDSWCTTHLDHGCLTGLTSAMFLDESESPSTHPFAELNELPTSPDPKSGLYILSRSGVINKVSIPRDALAFQTGEALELITAGKFKAVPHFVRGVDSNAAGVAGKRIARNTLAVFTQPNLDEVVELGTGLTFGEFARGVVKKNTRD
jgi:hypothetical protein